MPVYALTLLTLLFVALTASAILAALYVIIPAAYRHRTRYRRNR